MSIHTSRVSEKGQVTLPKRLREQIGLKSGDSVVYEVRDKEIVIRRVEPFDMRFHAALVPTLEEEWGSPEDDEAFRDL